MTVKVKLIELDGYEDWSPRRVNDITLPEFTPQAVTDYLVKDDEEPGVVSPNDFCHNGDGPIVKKGTITLGGEEIVYIAVLIG